MIPSAPPSMTAATVDQAAYHTAQARQQQLTKPPGALGHLEEIACWFAARQGRTIPQALVPAIVLFAADHGVTAEGVSAYPSVVTQEMVKNFAAKGAAINVLSAQIGARLRVVDVGVAGDLSAVDGIVSAKVCSGSGNIAVEPAMTAAACRQAIDVGMAQADRAIDDGATLLIGGEMGIGNTTPSAALICALLALDADDVVGNGTGVDRAGRAHKVEVVARAVARAGQDLSAMAMLEQLGGLEIAALVGLLMRAAQRGVPVVLDGFIVTAAALVAERMVPGVKAWWLASHRSQERGHQLALQALGLQPLLDLGMRLGEGSGAAVTVPLLQAAIALHAGMATFDSAGVSTADDG
ncbi:MAG: nicotinate-nucleotide--dimethylbenzimidazole phosphoribosyltransferase [Mariprofundales bacterium]